MNNKLIGNKNNIVFYTDEEGNTNIEVILQNEDVWLNAQAIAELLNLEKTPSYAGEYNKTYSFAQSNKKYPLKHDIIFKV